MIFVMLTSMCVSHHGCHFHFDEMGSDAPCHATTQTIMKYQSLISPSPLALSLSLVLCGFVQSAEITLNGVTRSYGLLLNDNFNEVTSNENATTFNNNLGQTQSGLFGTVNYSVQAPGGDWKAQHSNGGRLLLASNEFGTGSVSLNRNWATDVNAGNTALIVSFVVDSVSGYQDATNWTQFNIAGVPNLDGGNGGAGFSTLFRQNGDANREVGGALVNGSGSGLTAWAANDVFTYKFTDTAGSGSAFNGNGSQVTISRNGSVIGTYAMSQQSDAFLTWSAYNYGGPFGLGTFDNLSVRNAERINPLGDASTSLQLSNNAVLQLGDVDQTVSALNGTAGTSINLAPGVNTTSVLRIDNASANTFAGTISGIGAQLVKSGAGALTLSGNNTYTGTTTVSAGTLFVNGALGSSTVTVAANAIIGGTGILTGDLFLHGESQLAITNLNDALTVSGNISFGSGFGINNLLGLDWDSLDLNTSYTLISTNQTFDQAGLNHFGFENRVSVGNAGREAYFTNGSLALVIVPEPSVTLLGGLSLLALMRRKRA